MPRERASLELGPPARPSFQRDPTRGFLLEDSKALRPREAPCGCRVRGPMEVPCPARAPERGLVVAGTPCRVAWRHGLKRVRTPTSSFESVSRGLRKPKLWGNEASARRVCGAGEPKRTHLPSPRARDPRGGATGNCRSSWNKTGQACEARGEKFQF